MNYQAPPLSLTNKYLLICMVTLFVMQSLGQAIGAYALVDWLGLNPHLLWPWRWHAFLTYPLIENQLMSVLFNGLAIWFLGSELERQWGQKVYIKFLLTTTVVTGLLYFLLATFILKGTFLGGGTLHGSASFTFALCVAYAVIYPERQFLMFFVFPVSAKWFCLIMAGVDLYLGFFSGNPASWGHLIAMGLAFLIIRFQNLSWLAWWLNDSPKKKGRGAQHLKLVKDDQDKPPYWH